MDRNKPRIHQDPDLPRSGLRSRGYTMDIVTATRPLNHPIMQNELSDAKSDATIGIWLCREIVRSPACSNCCDPGGAGFF